MLISDLENVPNSPGVYIWKDKNETIIYVGKAKNLKNRMKQYIKGSINSYKTQKMMHSVASFDYVISSSAKEALILERNLINKYKPEYNIKLMDDKRYPYIKVQLFKNNMKIFLAYKTSEKNKNALFFGPFPSGYGAKKISDFLNREFIYKNGLPYKNDDSDYWIQQLNSIKDIMTRKKSLITTLRSKMTEFAENEQYEIAHDLKETIQSLKLVAEKQIAEINETKSLDAIAFYESSGYLSISQFFYRQGILLSKKQTVIEITSSLEVTTRQFISQYYSVNLKPQILMSNLELDSDLNVVLPNKGQKKQILDIALKNAEDNIETKLRDFIRKEELTIGALKKLKDLLKIKKLDHILMIDNSNFANENPISAFVSYRNGIKNKSEYKKYKLERSDRKADVEYMKQGITKYFNNVNNSKPDLLIVDGGIQQVNEIKHLVKNINLIGLVKNENHKTDSIVLIDGKKLKIEDQSLFNFLSGIQIEVDRFAKTFYRSRAIKSSLEGRLSAINGIGPKVEKKLLNKFKTYSAIYNASIEDLSKVVSLKLAKTISKEIKN